jgi:protein SCO1/2
MIVIRIIGKALIRQWQRLRATNPPGRGWARFMIMLFMISAPAFAFAHDSTSEVESEIRSRENYLELVTQVAPVFTLQDVDAKPVRLDDFRGKVVILNFIYSRCQNACPLHSLKLAEVQQQLALASVSDNVQFITVATDTEDDASTAESMRAHGPRYGLDPANWIFLKGPVGSEDLGMRFAAGYGLKFVPTDDGAQMHGVITFLIDTRGQLRARYHGLKFNSVNLTLHAAALIHDDHNKGEVKSVDSTTANSRALSIVLLAALVALVGLLCLAIFYYWKRHRNGARQSQTQVSPSGENIE